MRRTALQKIINKTRGSPILVLVCVGFALLSTANAAAVPSKASLSPKDKLALEIPIKQHLTSKAQGKQEGVKVSFPTTTTTTTSTTTETPKPQRPKYVDAAVFRHQFTTPAPPPSGPSAAAEKQATVVEVSRVTNRDAEPFAEEFSFPQTATAIIGSGAATAVEPVEDVESYDYEALLPLEDLSPFGGELDILGGDARSAGYLSSFRPVGF